MESSIATLSMFSAMMVLDSILDLLRPIIAFLLEGRYWVPSKVKSGLTSTVHLVSYRVFHVYPTAKPTGGLRSLGTQRPPASVPEFCHFYRPYALYPKLRPLYQRFIPSEKFVDWGRLIATRGGWNCQGRSGAISVLPQVNWHEFL